MPELGEVIEPVRIDHRERGRQLLVGLVVVDDDHFESESAGLRQRLVAGGAAVDRDEELRPALGERLDRLHVRPISFENAVGNVDQRLDARHAKKQAEQRRRCRAVDVVIAEDRDGLGALDRIGDALRRRFHRGDGVRIGHQPLDGGIEIGLDLLRLDATARDDAGEQLGQGMALDDRQRA